MRSPVYLSVQLITFESIGRFSLNSAGGNAIEGDLDAIISNRTASTFFFKTAELKTSDAGAKREAVSVGLSSVKFGNHANQTFVVW
jgi:hypothetical protein